MQVDVDQYYPKLRVRNSWDIGNQTPRSLIQTSFNGKANSVRSFDTSQNSDGFSQSSSYENLVHLANDDESMPTDSPQQFSVGIPKFIEINLHREETNEQSDENSDDVCKEVRCIEMKEPNSKRYLESEVSDSSPNKYANSNVASPVVDTVVSGEMVVENGHSTNEEFESTAPKNEKPSQTGFLVPSPEKPCMKSIRSRSCKARLMTSLSSCWFENIEEDEISTPPSSLEKSFTGRPEGFRKNLPSLNYGSEAGSLIENDLQTSGNDAADDEVNVPNDNSLVDGEETHIDISAVKELADPHCDNSLADTEVSVSFAVISSIISQNCLLYIRNLRLFRVRLKWLIT